MSRDTRKKILEKAKELFNEKGYNMVSISDIAGELDMSKGNLTYHFNKKESIVEALIQNIPDTRPKESAKSLRDLDDFFTDTQNKIKENAFYFWHHTQLAQVSETIRKEQEQANKATFDLLYNSFKSLNSNGLIRDEKVVNEYECIINSLQLSIVYWAPFEDLKERKNKNIDFRYQVWTTMYPILSCKGRKELLEIIDIPLCK